MIMKSLRKQKFKRLKLRKRKPKQTDKHDKQGKSEYK